jgi:hypothetical protein
VKVTEIYVNSTSMTILIASDQHSRKFESDHFEMTARPSIKKLSDSFCHRSMEQFAKPTAFPSADLFAGKQIQQQSCPMRPARVVSITASVRKNVSL